MRQLLLEGKDDLHVVRAIKGQFNIPRNQFEEIDCDGIASLTDIYIPQILKGDAVTVLGIIIDADSNIEARWQSLRNKFEQFDYSLPQNLPVDGFVLNGDDKRIGIWIMPNNNVNGMLEDFVSALIPDNDQLRIKANNILNEIEQEELNNYAEIHRSKAFIHTWLAWQEEPGKPLGLAITNHYLPTEVALCRQFVNWLNRLFTE